METGDGISTVFGENERFIDVLPEVQLLVERILGDVQASAQVVPAVVPVDAHYIHAPGCLVLGVIVLAADHRNRTVLRIEGMGFLIQAVPIGIGIIGKVLRIGFIAKAPHHHRWVILIPVDQLGEQRFMIGCSFQLGIRIDLALEIEADGRKLIDDDIPLPVAESVHLLGIRIMTGS